jgi:hypothetical protein
VSDVGTAAEIERAAGRAADEPPGPTRIPALVRDVLAAPGRRLDAATRAAVEPALAHDLGRVRVHDDAHAAEAAAAVGARGFAVGTDVVVQPSAPRSLMAHELAHVVAQHRTGPSLQRDELVPPDARKALLATSAATFAAPTKDVTEAALATLLDRWYRAITDTEQTITVAHKNDKTLRTEVRALYVAAVRALVPRATTSTGASVEDLYVRNSGRIPMWAWPQAHKKVAGISTPVAEGLSPSKEGVVTFPVGSFRVRIFPDAKDPKLGKGAETTGKFAYRGGTWTTAGGAVTKVTPGPAPVATIQTFFGPDASASATSGYGRGTTTEDLAGAKVDPRSRTLGFHEGEHGLDYVRHLRDNPPPTFPVTLGMPTTSIDAALAAWRTAWSAYEAAAKAASEASTDMVGTPKP